MFHGLQYRRVAERQIESTQGDWYAQAPAAATLAASVGLRVPRAITT